MGAPLRARRRRSSATCRCRRAFLPTSPTHGVRQNLAFEAAAVAPNGRHLFVGMEGALAQDGPAATLTDGSASRILRYNLASGRLERQYVYVDRPGRRAAGAGDELRGQRPRRAAAVQRRVHARDGALVLGRRARHREHDQALLGRVPGRDERRRPRQHRRRARDASGRCEKTLLLDLRTLGIPLDNVEGMTLGPKLPDGRQSLVLVSDNNFAASQFTQFLLFALD